MKKLLLALVLAAYSVGVFAQKANKNYVDGIIYFQLKQNCGHRIMSGAEGQTNLKDFSFLGDIANKYGITEIRRSFYMAKDEKLLRTYKVFFNKIYDVESLIKDLEAQNVVEYAEKLPVFKLSYVPNDPYYNYTTSYSGYTLNWKWHLDKIKASLAWDISKGSSAIRVAVTDNAIYTTHPDLQNKIVAMTDQGDMDSDPNPPATATGTLAYEWSHGSHVSGLIGAQSDNSVGIASIGFNVSLVAVKIARNSDGALISGYEGVTWASTTGQADVINMSWGGSTGGTTAQNVINAAYNQGCVLVAAAGNDGNNGNPTYYPASYTNVIAVAATNSDDTKADFSEYGTWVDVCAPGGNEKISTTYFTPLVSTTFNNTLGLNTYYGIPNTTFGSGKYDGMQGTSMASPIVAGLAGLILSVNPAMTQTQVRNCIVNTADNISSVNSSYSGQIGSGRINAQAALQCAQASASVAPTPAFTGNPLNICPGSVVTFTNQTANATTYTWTFQGGTPATSTSTATTINVTYNTPGVYSVTLAATNAYGTNSTVKTAYVNVIGGATPPLVEGFQSSTFAPTNWYLVDAASDNIQWQLSTTVGYGTTQSALFDNYNNDAGGNRDQLKTYVNLSGYSSAKMTFYRAYAAFQAPYSDTLNVGVSTNCGSTLTYTWSKGGATLQTAAATTTASAFTPTGTAQWKKDSVDLTPWIGQSRVMIVFENRGHYGNALYLDNINITGTTTSTVAPTATISVSSNTICVGKPLTLTSSTTGSPTSYSWSTGGGTPASATTSSTSVTYSSAGVKTISLTVSSGTLSSTSTKTVNVIANPTINATASSTLLCSGQSSTITATGGTTYSWAPNSSSSATVVVSPTTNTTYTVTGTTSGCSSTKTVSVNVSACTGIDQLLNDNIISVFPNPNQGSFIISTSIQDVTATIFNTLGQVVVDKALNVSENSIDVSAFGKGIYYVQLHSSSFTKTVKVVVE